MRELVHGHVGNGDDQGAKHSTELHRGGGMGEGRQWEGGERRWKEGREE